MANRSNWTPERIEAERARRRENNRRREITRKNTSWPKQEPESPKPVETWMYSRKVMDRGYAGKLVVQSRGLI